MRLHPCLTGLFVAYLLYGCRPKSVSAGLGCSLDCTPALSVMHSAAAAAGCGLCYVFFFFAFRHTDWRLISAGATS